MLKEYLPELKNLPNQQNPLNNFASSEAEPENDPNSSPNLLYPLKKKNLETEIFQRSLAKTFFLLALIPPILTLGLFITSGIIKAQLRGTISERDILAAEMQSRDFKDREAMVVIKKIELIKEVSPEDRLFNTKVSTLIEDLPASIELANVDISPQKAMVTTKSASALPVAQLILHYLNTGKVKEVTIISADLQVSDGVYVVNLELGY